MESADSCEGDFFTTSQGPTTPGVESPAPLGSPEHGHGELKAVLSPTHNGFNSVPNYVTHKQKPEMNICSHPEDKPSKDMKLQSNLFKHHTNTGIVIKSSDNIASNSKHKSSNHSKHKESDPSKHKSHSSSHSKPKDGSSSKDSLIKVHSSKPNDITKPKEHTSDKEKKHSSSISKTKETIFKLDNDHPRHSGDQSKNEDASKKESKPKDGKEEDSVRKDGEKHKSSSHKPKDGIIKSKEKHKEGREKEDGKHKERGELKEKDFKLRDSKEHKDNKMKDNKDKEHKEKSKEKKEVEKMKDGKLKEKVKEKQKEGSMKDKEKIKEGNEKPLDKIKDQPSHKDSSLISKVKVENESHLSKKSVTLKVKESHSQKTKEAVENHQVSVKNKHEEHSKEKVKNLSEKSKDKSDKGKEISVTKDSSFASKVKGEVNSKKPIVLKVKEPVENHISIKEEPLSDDDVPLSARKSQKETKVKPTKHIKRERDESDDEPQSLRAEKVKKPKADGALNKKRKYEDDEKPLKKAKKDKENKNVQQAEVPSPKKRGKQKEDEQEVWKWWEEEKYEDGVKWRTLQHQGPVFAPGYERLPKNVRFFHKGKPMELSEGAEEVAGFYAVMLEHEYTTKESFNKNFFKDWKKVMTPEEREIITDLKLCGFNEIHAYYKKKSEDRKNMTKEEKLEIRKQNEELQKKYGFCIIDGHKQKIGNFKIEPPGLFRGRGEHPKMGMLKKRVQPEDVIINIGREGPIPEPPEGHRWKEVRHDKHVTWLASWTENIHGQTKYIMLNPSSKLKGEKDWQKYETARKLKSRVEKIRQDYKEDWKSKEMKVRQRAVALYFIDKLALRAGNEKEEGETADTVGCCSLRVEHITLCEEEDGEQYVVKFDFLGKDSIRYVNSVPVEKRVFKNLKLFMENKQPGDDLFDRLNTAILNKYLNELMEGLTAKVFRTFNASKTLQEQLELLTKPEMSIPEMLLTYNRANRAVAILCNHQRSVPKTFSKTMENLQKKIDEKLEQIKEFKKELKKTKQVCKDGGSDKDRQLYEKKKNRLKQLEEQLKKLEVQATDKEENKQIALGTSKLNYLDPRISVAWCKKWSVPIEKIYNRTQRDKFRWAIEMAGPDFKF